jgi:hypothetical protein
MWTQRWPKRKELSKFPVTDHKARQRESYPSARLAVINTRHPRCSGVSGVSQSPSSDWNLRKKGASRVGVSSGLFGCVQPYLFVAFASCARILGLVVVAVSAVYSCT